MNKFITFFKQKTTIISLIVGVVYSAIMMGIFLPSYSAMPNNLDELPVAIVNEDKEQGVEITKQLQEKLPFTIDENLNLKEAEEALDNREIYLVIHIPKDFTANLSNEGVQAQMNFKINAGNPSLISSAMESVVNEIVATFDSQIESNMLKGVLMNLQVPEEQVTELAALVGDKFNANIEITNEPILGMHNQMGPMMLVIACNVAAMITSMMLVQSLNSMRSVIGKWKSYIAMHLAMIITAIITPLAGLGIFFGLESYGTETFMTIWGTNALLIIAALEIFLIFTMIFGQGGMLFNLIFLLSQVISGTGVLPNEINYPIIQFISKFSPAYYAIQANMTTIFGGGQFTPYILGLIYCFLGGLFMTFLIQLFKSESAPIPKSII